MITLKSLTPINLQEEKQKFFSDNSYNPQFVYEEEIDDVELLKYGTPKLQVLALAKEVLQRAYSGKSEAELFSEEGSPLNQAQVTQKVEQFLSMHKLENRYKVVWSSTFISRASVGADTVKLRLPCEFRHEGLLGMMYHEIGTHALRRVNYEKQPWFKKKSRYGFSEYLRTEEGLAVLHGLIPHSNKLAFIQAIRYLAVDFALHHSFAELWQLLTPYVEDLERRWTVCVRQKRGLSNTSKPGAFTKDLVYFEGMIEVWNWLTTHNFDLHALYFGKMSYEDVDKALDLNPTFVPQLPVFYTHYRDQYLENIAEIGRINMLDTHVSL